MKKKYIGLKPIKEVKDGGKTPNGVEVVEVFYEDNTREVFSKLMYDKIVSEESCDLTQLREKRITPIVEQVLLVMRNWGIKVSELPYFSSLLNQSMQANEKEAMRELWLDVIPTLADPDDVDLIAIDLILRKKAEKEELKKLNPIQSPYNEEK
jgi:hypothetical protein